MVARIRLRPRTPGADGSRWRITVPIQFLLPWDDEHAGRQSALALFDAFASKEKTLHANPGDHRNMRWFGVDNEFLVRHLGQVSASPA